MRVKMGTDTSVARPETCLDPFSMDSVRCRLGFCLKRTVDKSNAVRS